MKFKIGDKVIIISDSVCHGLNIGEVYEISGIYETHYEIYKHVAHNLRPMVVVDADIIPDSTVVRAIYGEV